MARMRRVALLIETSREYGREILRGVIRYQGEHGPWSVYFRPHGLGDPPPPWLNRWHGDGILARINDRRLARAVLRSGLPAIDLRFALDHLGLPGVGVNNLSVVRLAFDHLRDRGLRHFAFCGLPRREYVWMARRCDLFQQLVEAAGHDCSVFEARRDCRRPLTWDREQEQLAAWIARLPRPVGVMACNDDRGQQVLDACHRAGVLVPDEVAVLGVDNDEFLCKLSMPPLSSIDVNARQIGYEAAALLDRMMAGKPGPRQPILVEPRFVVARQSTDVLAMEDREMVAALQFIRAHACDGIGVADVLEHVLVSRSALERRFHQLLGRTPKAEIVRVRLDRAQRLLAETDLPISVVAAKTGFGTASYLSYVLWRQLGRTAATFRAPLA